MKVPDLSEKDFQRQVVGLARLHGWLVFHDYDSRRSAPGFPDLVMVRHNASKPLFVELKTKTGKLSDAQTEWGLKLESCPGADYRVWRPEDMEEIVKTLAKRRAA